MKKIDIIIVDDHLLFSEGLDGLISDFEEFNVLAVLANGLELIDYFSTENVQPDIVLMDIQMPLMNGLEATKWLKKSYPKIKVLGLSNECDEEIILKMLRAGANGYLGKVIHPSELEFALKEVYTKAFFFTENVSATLLNSLEVKGHKEVIVFKEKELEFLKLACTEMTYRQIAETMYLSPKTIENYREALFEKLNVKSRIGLVLFAIKEKIVIL